MSVRKIQSVECCERADVINVDVLVMFGYGLPCRRKRERNEMMCGKMFLFKGYEKWFFVMYDYNINLSSRSIWNGCGNCYSLSFA